MQQSVDLYLLPCITEIPESCGFGFVCKVNDSVATAQFGYTTELKYLLARDLVRSLFLVL